MVVGWCLTTINHHPKEGYFVCRVVGGSADFSEPMEGSAAGVGMALGSLAGSASGRTGLLSPGSGFAAGFSWGLGTSTGSVLLSGFPAGFRTDGLGDGRLSATR